MLAAAADVWACGLSSLNGMRQSCWQAYYTLRGEKRGEDKETQLSNIGARSIRHLKKKEARYGKNMKKII